MGGGGEQVTVKAGDRLKINDWKATVLKVDGNYALLKTDGGSQICYGILGIRPSQILKEEKPAPGTQLKLI
jgi:hypothetical protein